MGSKKLKRKKLRNKRQEKFCKLKSDKPKKSILYEFNRESIERNIPGDRLNSKNCSRSFIGEKNISDVKYFAKVREDYFRHLQTVVCKNCMFFDSVLTEEILENLALELEQNALLACLQVEVYKKAMLKIIKAINKSTEEKQIHKDVKKLLPESLTQERIDEANTPKSTANSTEFGMYNTIPTITLPRTEDNLESDSFWPEEPICNEESYYLVTNHCEEAYYENQNVPEINSNAQSGGEDEISLMVNQPNSWNNESVQTNKSDIEISSDVIDNHSSVFQNNFNDLSIEQNTITCFSSQAEKKQEVDPLSLSRNQLQKLVEQTLNETEKVNRQKRDEQERACIAQILEGDDSLDERFNDSLSDNDNESKENIDESNLMDRLEKMKELFGMDNGESQTETIPQKPKQSNKVSHAHNRNRRPTIWRYEKFIHLHKYSIIASEMTLERRQINQRIFLELFGEDSDEEHEAEFSSTEKYRSSCTERISSWVVKYLMPFYHDKRILGRSVFKSLGHHISDTIVDEIQYPDEWTVKYFVSKFFPPKKKYACDADILNFQLD